MEKLKDHINMHFIGQVKKRKADNEPEKGHENEESQSSSQSNSASAESPSEHSQSKRARKEEEEGGLNTSADSDPIVDIKQEKEKDGGLKCSNCDTSFFNVTTFRAHVSYYCKNRDNAQN